MDTAHPIADTIGQASDYHRESATRAGTPSEDEAMRIMAAQLAMIERKASGLLLEREQAAFKNCDPILAYNRVSRSMLQIMAMEQEIVGLREKRRCVVRATPVEDNKQLVRRAVRDAAIIRRPDIKPDRLRDLLRDAIYDHNWYDDFVHDSPRAIIAKICEQLGIDNPDLSIWPDEAPMPTADPIPETPEATIARLEAEFARARAAERDDQPPPPPLRPNGHGPP